MFILINGSGRWSRAVWCSIMIIRTTRLREMRERVEDRMVLEGRKEEAKS